MVLNDVRKGSTRQEIYKCLSSKFPETNYKNFIVQLKKLSSEGTVIKRSPKNSQRFFLSEDIRKKILAARKKGNNANIMSVKSAQKLNAFFDKAKVAAKRVSDQAKKRESEKRKRTSQKAKDARGKAKTKAAHAKKAA